MADPIIVNIPSLPAYPDNTVLGKIAISNPTTGIAYEVSFTPSDLLAVSQPTGLTSDFFGVADPTGWLICDGDTIGSAGSAATHKGTDYQALYNHLWDMIVNHSANLTISTGAGASAAADWAANKSITIPNCEGLGTRALGTQSVNGRTKTGQTNLGDIQEDSAQGHKHQLDSAQNPLGDSTGKNNDIAAGLALGGASAISAPITDGSNGTPRVGSENQISSIGFNKIIKL